MLFLLMPLAAFATETGTWQLSTGFYKPWSARAQTINAIVKECFRRLDIEIESANIPSVRALEEANNGKFDATYLRFPGLSRKYPNLIMVPEPVSAEQLFAYTTLPDITPQSWKDLLAYHVAYIKGWQICERNLKEAKQVTESNSPQILFDFVSEGRADIAVTGKGIIDLQKKNMGIPSNVRQITEFKERDSLHIYLHKKQRARIPDFNKTLKAMKLDGTYERLEKLFGWNIPYEK